VQTVDTPRPAWLPIIDFAFRSTWPSSICHGLHPFSSAPHRAEALGPFCGGDSFAKNHLAFRYLVEDALPVSVPGKAPVRCQNRLFSEMIETRGPGGFPFAAVNNRDSIRKKKVN